MYAAKRGIGALGFQFATPAGAQAWVNKYYNIVSSDQVEPLCEYEMNPNIAIVSGFVFIEDIFAQSLVHKTVLTIVAWALFSVLLWQPG